MNHHLPLFFLLINLFFGCKYYASSETSNPKAPTVSNYPEQKPPSDAIKKYISFDQPIIAILNAKLIDGSGAAALDDQTILIENGYFKSLGPSQKVKVPKEATRIDAQGKTVIPGLVGAHNHMHIPRFPFLGEAATKLYLAAGVTTIMTCGAASPIQELNLSKQIAAGEAVGPDIVPSAPYITGEGGNRNMIIPRNERQLRDTMQHWIQQGIRWFKVYRHTPPRTLKIVIEEAHAHGAKVTGHLCATTFAEAAKLGIDGIEHGLNSASDFRDNKSPGKCDGIHAYMDDIDISSSHVRDLLQLLIDQKVSLTSTLSIYETSIPQRGFADERSLAVMSPFLKQQYAERRERYDNDDSGIDREKRLKRIMAFEYQFVNMGGLLGSGVDAGRHNMPGYGDQRNFELLLEAGFSTEEAIMIMTSNGAKILENDKIGTIEVGKRADLVILDGDLAQARSGIRKVEQVFKVGRGYDPRLLIKDVGGKIGID